MESIWNEELKRFFGLAKEQQTLWFANLMFLLTVFARDCYSSDNSVQNPVALRRYNELMHRVASQQVKVAIDDEKRFPVSVLFEMIEEEFNALGVDCEYVVSKLRLV